MKKIYVRAFFAMSIIIKIGQATEIAPEEASIKTIPIGQVIEQAISINKALEEQKKSLEARHQEIMQALKETCSMMPVIYTSSYHALLVAEYDRLFKELVSFCRVLPVLPNLEPVSLFLRKIDDALVLIATQLNEATITDDTKALSEYQGYKQKLEHIKLDIMTLKNRILTING